MCKSVHFSLFHNIFLLDCAIMSKGAFTGEWKPPCFMFHNPWFTRKMFTLNFSLTFASFHLKKVFSAAKSQTFEDKTKSVLPKEQTQIPIRAPFFVQSFICKSKSRRLWFGAAKSRPKEGHALTFCLKQNFNTSFKRKLEGREIWPSAGKAVKI